MHFECGEIGATFVNVHGRRRAILGDRFFKVTPGCSLVPMGAQQKVDGTIARTSGSRRAGNAGV
jgi:hypothetical protein